MRKVNIMKHFNKDKIIEDFEQTIYNYLMKSYYINNIYHKYHGRYGAVKYFCAILTSLQSFVISIMNDELEVLTVYLVNLKEAYLSPYEITIDIIQYDIASNGDMYIYKFSYINKVLGFESNTNIVTLLNTLILEGNSNNNKKQEAEKLSNLLGIDIKVIDIFNENNKGYNLIQLAYYDYRGPVNDIIQTIGKICDGNSDRKYVSYSINPDSFCIVKMNNNTNKIEAIYRVEFSENDDETSIKVTKYIMKDNNCFMYKNIVDYDDYKSVLLDFLEYTVKSTNARDYIDIEGKVINIIGNINNFICPYKFNNTSHTIKISKDDFYSILVCIVLLVIFLLLCLFKAI